MAANPLIENSSYNLINFIKLSLTFIFLYSDCYLEDLLIGVGKTVDSFSGLFNTATTSGVYILNLLDTTSPTNDINLLNDAATNTNLKEFGKILGNIVTKIFNIQVPDNSLTLSN